MRLYRSLGDFSSSTPYDYPNGAQVGEQWIDGPLRIFLDKSSEYGWGEVWQPHGRIGTLRPGLVGDKFVGPTIFTREGATVPIYSKAQLQAYLQPATSSSTTTPISQTNPESIFASASNSLVETPAPSTATTAITPDVPQILTPPSNRWMIVAGVGLAVAIALGSTKRRKRTA